MAAWIAGTLEAPGKPEATGVGHMALLGFFSSPWELTFKGLPWLVLLYCSVHQALKGPLSLGSFFIAHPLVPACLGREVTGIAPASAHDSAVVPCFHTHFPPKAFPTMDFHPSISSGRLPIVKNSPGSPWDCSPIPASSSQPLCALVDLHPCLEVCRTMAWMVCVVLTPFRLLQISCFTLIVSDVSPPSQPIAPDTGISPLLQLTNPQLQFVLLSLLLPSFLHPTELCVDPHISFQLSGTSAGISWCFMRTAASVDVFLMHPWKEICPMSTQSSTILSTLCLQLLCI